MGPLYDGPKSTGATAGPRAPGKGREPASAHQSAGFTLVEALVVLLIAAALLGIGVPGFRDSLERSRAATRMMELQGLLALSRQQAVVRRFEVTLCGTEDSTRCAANWNGNPTLVFVDANSNRIADATEDVLALSSLTRAGSIRWRASGGRGYMRFRPDGSAKEFGTFQYCPGDRNARDARQVIVSATGRARAAVDADGDGIVEDRDGRPLRCD